MRHHVLFAALLTTAIACSAQTAPPDPKHGSNPPPGRANLAPAAPPFKVETIGQFDQPFALAFLSDGRLLVTEKAGRLKLRDSAGAVTDVEGVPAVAAGGQGGLLDVIAAPDFAATGRLYLTYAEGPDSAHSQLALMRAVLAPNEARCGPPSCPDPGHSLVQRQVIWRSGSAGKGGQFRARRQVAVPVVGRAPAFHPRAGPGSGAGQDCPPDARWEAVARQPGRGQDRRGDGQRHRSS